MKKKKKDEESALPAWLCVMDARNRDEQNRPLYSDEQKELGYILYGKVSACYDAHVYRNYRENFICVKVAAPSIANKKSAAVAALHQWCEENNIEIKTRGKNVLYHIKIDK